MGEFVLSTVSVVSLIATALMAVLAYLIAKAIWKKCSSVDKAILFWLIWDAMIHFTIVRIMSCFIAQVS